MEEIYKKILHEQVELLVEHSKEVNNIDELIKLNQEILLTVQVINSLKII